MPGPSAGGSEGEDSSRRVGDVRRLERWARDGRGLGWRGLGRGTGWGETDRGRGSRYGQPTRVAGWGADKGDREGIKGGKR